MQALRAQSHGRRVRREGKSRAPERASASAGPGAGTSGFVNILSGVSVQALMWAVPFPVISGHFLKSYFANHECVLLQATGRQVLSAFSNFPPETLGQKLWVLGILENRELGDGQCT